MKKHIFMSHSSKDDGFVKALRKSLEIQKLDTWVDSRQLAGGDELEPEIKKAIEQARAFIVVLSQNAFNSPWILKEVNYALKMKKKQPDDYPFLRDTYAPSYPKSMEQLHQDRRKVLGDWYWSPGSACTRHLLPGLCRSKTLPRRPVLILDHRGIRLMEPAPSPSHLFSR